MMNYKPIRNKIKGYTYESIVSILLTILQKLDNEKTPQPFWHPLLLLQWAMEFAEENYPYKKAELIEIVNLIKKLEPLEMAHKTFGFKNDQSITKTFTILAAQQFSYQQNVWLDTFSRQYILFNQIIAKYNVTISFKLQTGLDPGEFIQSMYVLWLYIFSGKFKYNGHIGQDIGYSLRKILGEDKSKKFVDLLSISRESARNKLSKDPMSDIRNYDLQVFATSPFSRRPFFSFKGDIIIPM